MGLFFGVFFQFISFAANGIYVCLSAVTQKSHCCLIVSYLRVGNEIWGAGCRELGFFTFSFPDHGVLGSCLTSVSMEEACGDQQMVAGFGYKHT